MLLPAIQRPALAVAMLLLAACAAPAESRRMLVSADASASYPPLLYAAIVVGSVGGGQMTHPWLVSRVDDAALHAAMQGSLQQAGLLASAGQESLQLDAFLVELKQPVSGYDMIVDSFVRYRLWRLRDGRVLLDELVQGSCKAGVQDEPIGVHRLKLANECAIHANLTHLLQVLQALPLGAH